MTEQNGKQNRQEPEVSAEAVDSLSSQVGKEIKKLLALICECRKSCKNTTQLVGDLNDAIK